MRTVSIFQNNRCQSIRLPKDMEFQGIVELEIRKEGDTLIPRPACPSWSSLKDVPVAEPDFLLERKAVIEEGRIHLSEDA